MAIIGISGKKQSGKDTIGRIIQVLIDSPHFTNKAVAGFLKREPLSPSFIVEKFANSLKDMMCILLGCSREDLEDEEFKNTELPEEWWYWQSNNALIGITTTEEYDKLHENQQGYYEELIKPTPRLLLQLLGTECGRNILHPNIWVNALMSNYKKNIWKGKSFYAESIGRTVQVFEYPNWLITDVRFHNEVDAILKREGLLIRVNKDIKHDCPSCQGGGCPVCSGYGFVWGENNKDLHPSETSLDKYQGFHEVIQNDGTIEELIQKVREILIKYKFINV